LAPALITGYLLADHFTPMSARTEASGWIDTATTGATASAALAALLVDDHGVTSVLATGAGSAGDAHSSPRSARAAWLDLLEGAHEIS
jgi:hypothetical protein